MIQEMSSCLTTCENRNTQWVHTVYNPLLFPLFLLHFFFFNNNLKSVVTYLMEKEMATHSNMLA